MLLPKDSIFHNVHFSLGHVFYTGYTKKGGGVTFLHHVLTSHAHHVVIFHHTDLYLYNIDWH